MRVLYVISGNSNLNKISPFIKEQVESIANLGVEVDYFLIKGRGLIGYLKNIRAFNMKIKRFKPDIVHAHYGLSGLFANLQRKVPVVTTFHGSDINEYWIWPFSLLATIFSAYSIFVSEEISKKIFIRNNYSVIPCAVDISIFYPIDKSTARKRMNFGQKETIILFSSSFDIPVKNYSLALAAIKNIRRSINLVELRGYSREEVNLLLNSCDIALLTSKSEGSPQFIKEALACNCAIVATDVGDVKSVVGDTSGCYITNLKATHVTLAIEKALCFDKKINGRVMVKHLTPESIANRVFSVYEKVHSIL